MAYKPPPELRARVENIKKKFEIVSDIRTDHANGDTSKTNPSQNAKSYKPQNNNNSPSPKRKSPLVKEVLNSDSGGTCSSKVLQKWELSSPEKADRQPSNSSSKGNIRRSPAFRCDKTMRAPNMVGQPAVNWSRPQSVVNHRVKMFESEQQNAKKGVTQTHTNILTKVCEFQDSNKYKINLDSEQLPDRIKSCTQIVEKLENSNDCKNLDNSFEENKVNVRNTLINCRRTSEHTSELTVTSASKTPGYASIMKTLKSKVPLQRIDDKNNDQSRVNLKKLPSNVISSFEKSSASDEFQVDCKLPLQNSKLHLHNNIFPASHISKLETGKQGENDKKNKDDDSNVLTQTLKAALQAPLPDGPPPKKPPRTFVHGSPAAPHGGSTIQERIQNLQIGMREGISVHATSNNTGKKVALPLSLPEVKAKPLRSKTEPHIMLKKLETALMNHQQGIGGVVIKPRTPLLNSRKECGVKALENDDSLNSPAGKPGGGRAGPLPSVPSEPSAGSEVHRTLSKPPVVEKQHDNIALLGGCLDSLSCVSVTDPQYVQGHFYEKLAEKQSEFFVDVATHLKPSFSSNGSLNESQDPNSVHLKKSRSEEHIYAEPYAFLSDEEKLARLSKSGVCTVPMNENSDGRGSTDLAPVMQLKLSKPKTLHYMCTPITVSPLDRLDALTKCNLRTGNINEALNVDVVVPRKLENCDKTDLFSSQIETGFEEKQSLRKASLQRFATLVKSLQNSASTDTINKLDRSKIQLFMNQAFGSPLQGMPITPVDETTSDSESLASSPEETYPPVFSSEDEGQSSEEPSRGGAKMATSSEDSASIASLEQQHQDLSKLTEERKVYVRRVSSRIFNSCQRLTSPDSFPHLFHCVMLVGLNLDSEKRIKVPYIKTKYPPNAVVPPLIEHLCFPDASDWPPPSFPPGTVSNKSDEQSYSLVITNEAGERKFGYCRRVMPEGAHICLPLAYCIISPFRAKGFYYKILQELESRHGQPEWLQTAFIKELYACEFPNPGQALKLPTSHHGAVGHGSPSDSLLSCIANQLRRPLDLRLEERDLTQLFSTLSVPVLLQVFGSLLLERKVLFISCSLNKLSACVEALQSILYPFSWQYTFIPVLPSTKLEVCEAPTPYIIGVLKGKDGQPPAVNIEDGIVVDLEESRILQCVGDESTILPARLKRGLKLALQLVDGTTQEHEPSRNVLVSEAFVRMFVEVCGHYTTHIVTQQDGRKVFERESFIKAVPSRSIQLFLEWFTETGMFTIFIDSRLNNLEAKGVFEQRAMEHSEEMDKNTMLFLRNYKALNKKVKTIGDRLKDWTSFT
ncbi:uncharacterized protein [Anabrus simplex]|uniref:uncharacterized protein n=1 Tax=Anabrus simplex TaxID=316456 RepID=UPI0035A34F97